MSITRLVDTCAIIPAAGQGRRMGGQGNKLLLELAGTPVLLFTLKTFNDCPWIREIIVSAAKVDILEIEQMVGKSGINKVTAVVEGGKERQDSVYNALQALNPEIKRVIVHDGARPLLTAGKLNDFFEQTVELKAAVMAVRPKDTIKIADEDGWVVSTPTRETMRLIQTPQVFDRLLLEKVHKLANESGYYTTDDASLMEWQGYQVRVIEGSYENIKVTTPEDLLIAEMILKKRGEW